MKASEILRGYLQIQRIPLPMAGMPKSEADLESWRAEHPGEPDPQLTVEVGLLPLEPGANAVIMERGRQFAKERGLEDPKEGDDLYEYGKAIHRVLLGVVDPDSDPRSPEPFFDEGIQQLLAMRELGQDGILTLAWHHEGYSQSISGQAQRLTEEDFEQALEEVAGPGGYPFWCGLRPGTQWSLAATMASLLLAALKHKFFGGSGGEPSLNDLRKKAEEKRLNTTALSKKSKAGDP